jgi:hypothetical protein
MAMQLNTRIKILPTASMNKILVSLLKSIFSQPAMERNQQKENEGQ